MTKILLFAGKKQSGKSSAASFVSAYVLTQTARLNPSLPLPKKFTQDEDGDIVIDTAIYGENGEKQFLPGVLDFHRMDEDFVNFALQHIWPYVKIYAYSDILKAIAMNVFGLRFEQCYGTNEEKNTETNIKWSQMFKLLPSKRVAEINQHLNNRQYMTGREFLQFFGSDICRVLYDDCWIDTCLSRIDTDQPEIAIIEDGRFKNEILKTKSKNARVIKFTKSIENDSHISENGMDDLPDDTYDLIIDNTKLTLREKNQIILDNLYNWGWFSGHVEG